MWNGWLHGLSLGFSRLGWECAEKVPKHDDRLQLQMTTSSGSPSTFKAVPKAVLHQLIELPSDLEKISRASRPHIYFPKGIIVGYFIYFSVRKGLLGYSWDMITTMLMGLLHFWSRQELQIVDLQAVPLWRKAFLNTKTYKTSFTQNRYIEGDLDTAWVNNLRKCIILKHLGDVPSRNIDHKKWAH